MDVYNEKAIKNEICRRAIETGSNTMQVLHNIKFSDVDLKVRAVKTSHELFATINNANDLLNKELTEMK